MEPYVAVVVLVGALAQLSAAMSRYFAEHRTIGIEQQRLFWTPADILIIVVLVAFAGLRRDVGTDYSMYVSVFSQLNPDGNWWEQATESSQEFGYTFFALFVKSVSADPTALMLGTSFLTIIPAFAAIKKFSVTPTISLLLYILLAFYVAPFNIIRQGIAVSLVFWAYTFINQRRGWLTFSIIVAVAATFHVSALVAGVIMLATKHWRPSLKSVLIIIVAAQVAAGTIITFPALARYMGLLNSRYDSYLTEDYTSGLGSYLNVIAFLILLVVSLALRSIERYPQWVAILTFAVVSLAIGTQSVPAGRLFYYFGIFSTLLIPNALARQKYSIGPTIAILAGSTIYFFFYLTHFGGLIPYKATIFG